MTIGRPTSDATKAVLEVRHVALPVVALAAIIAILYFGRLFFVTSIAAVIIAFILEPLVTLLMRARLPRSVAAFVACCFALFCLYIVGLGAYSQLTLLYRDMPTYGQRVGDMIEGVRAKIQGVEKQTYRVFLPARQRQQLEDEEQRAQKAAEKKRKKGDPTPVTPPPAAGQAPTPDSRAPIGDYIYNNLSSFYQILLMISFVPFLVYFMLSWRDHVNRAFLQLFQGEARMIAARSLAGIADMVRAFVVGNFLVGMMLAIISSSMFYSMHLPYPLLVGPLSGLLSLVPYIGLPLAMMPPLFVALGPNQVGLYVAVILSVGILHLIGLNVFYPKIVGSRVHLNPLIVTFSLMIWGYLWDAPGLILAIPLTAATKAVCDNVKALRPIGKFLGD